MRMNSGFRATGIFSRAVLVSRPAFRTERAIVCLCPVCVPWMGVYHGDPRRTMAKRVAELVSIYQIGWRTIMNRGERSMSPSHGARKERSLPKKARMG